MLFNSWQFAVFLPLVFLAYWALNPKFRWILLLAASYYFYMSWNVKYIVLILFTTFVSYAGAILIEKYKYKKFALCLTIVSCLGVLFIFKYFDFFSQAVIDIFKLFSIRLHPITLKLMLPVGISFYTFQTLSYVIDVYKGKIKPERHFGIYATFISFFPQLVAGPIERTENLLPQIKSEHKFNYEQAVYGLQLIAWGFFKKLVIADNLALSVDSVYDNLYQYRGFALIIATIFFTIQIYCDFSGYSDIARGSAKLMGIELMENFRAPYLSSSIREFWGRWHISLSTWFRDYVYIPLGGSRVSKLRNYFNLIVTFLVSGLWHGANWTFVIWGGVHGLAQIIEKIFNFNTHTRINTFKWFFKTIFVFIFVAAAWIFFRAQSFADVIYIFSHMFDGIANLPVYIKTGFDAVQGQKRFFIGLSMILAAYDYIFVLKNQEPIELLNRQNVFIRWFCYIAMGFILVFFSQKGAGAEFVYFQF